MNVLVVGGTRFFGIPMVEKLNDFYEKHCRIHRKANKYKSKQIQKRY